MVIRTLTDHPCHMAMVGRTIVQVVSVDANGFWTLKEHVTCPLSGRCAPGFGCEFSAIHDQILKSFGPPGTVSHDEVGRPAESVREIIKEISA